VLPLNHAHSYLTLTPNRSRVTSVRMWVRYATCSWSFSTNSHRPEIEIPKVTAEHIRSQRPPNRPRPATMEDIPSTTDTKEPLSTIMGTFDQQEEVGRLLSRLTYQGSGLCGSSAQELCGMVGRTNPWCDCGRGIDVARDGKRMTSIPGG